MRALWLLLVVVLAGCQSAPPTRPAFTRLAALEPPEVVPEETAIARAGFAPGHVGYVVLDAATGEVIAQANADQPFLPASVGKVPTTIAALQVLGADHRFATTLAARGTWEGGKLHGDLYLRGEGDPLLTLAELMELAEALHTRGLTELDGAFYYDESFLPARDRIHPRQDEDAVFNTGVSALSSEFNRLALVWRGDGEALGAYFSPAVPSTRLELGQPPWRLPGVGYRGAEDADTWILPPDLPSEGHRELPVRHPGLYTAQVFASFCAAHGLTLPAPRPGATPKQARVLHTHLSAPLAELVSRNLEWSNNLISELLLLSTARKLSGRAENVPEAAAIVTHWLQRQVGVNWNGYFAENGSGLSPQGRMTPAQGAALLRWADTRTFGGKAYLSLLPIAGWKGSLRDRMSRPETALRVWAKTGTMKYGSALAGFFFSRTNRKRVFALMVSDLARRQAFDAAAPDAATFREWNAEGADWVERARRLQDELVTGWVQGS